MTTWTKEHADLLDSMIRYHLMDAEGRATLIAARTELQRRAERIVELEAELEQLRQMVTDLSNHLLE